MLRRPPTAQSSRPSTIAVTALFALLVGCLVFSGGAAAAENAAFTPTDENATFHPAANQTVAGTTTLEAGSEVRVRLRSSGPDQTPFLKTATTNVTDEGTYEASFNFSSMPRESGGPVTVTVLEPNSSDPAVEYERWFADSTPFDPEDESRTVEAKSDVTLSGYATLDAGTEVRVRLQSGDGSSPKFLKTRTTNVTEAGTYAATFDLRDVGNQTAPIVVTVEAPNRPNATYEYEISLQSSETTASSTATSQSPTETGTEGSTVGTSLTEAPGFGVWTALAAVASLVAVAFASRR